MYSVVELGEISPRKRSSLRSPTKHIETAHSKPTASTSSPRLPTKHTQSSPHKWLLPGFTNRARRDNAKQRLLFAFTNKPMVSDPKRPWCPVGTYQTSVPGVPGMVSQAVGQERPYFGKTAV
ncbi:hypothetical protein L873DRAFT_1845452 [Choiromyces venosus 120613-1]|uniref:Uncharacterized protein n=1 Tax=Choiromyces venosus 120613-1 TaxID=1336337 RepID=A0A3N4JIW7_9PEZI|nr:hypothetical protein L873DRAFT_1845452 [Choiromyces venosus 120613-1]